MTSPTPKAVTTKEAMDNAFRLTSELLASLQKLRLERGSMGRKEFREKEMHLVQDIALFVNDYQKLAEQYYLESE